MHSSLAVVAFLACCGLTLARSYLPSQSSLSWRNRGSLWNDFGDDSWNRFSRWNRPVGFNDPHFLDNGVFPVNSGLLHHDTPVLSKPVVSTHRRYRRDTSYLPHPHTASLGLNHWNSFNTWDNSRWGSLGGLSSRRFFPRTNVWNRWSRLSSGY